MNFENVAGLVEMAFVYTIALGFGLWQVRSIRRELKRSREAQTHTQTGTPEKE